MDGIIDSMGTNWSKLQETVKGREAWRATVHGVTESDTTERLNSIKNTIIFCDFFFFLLMLPNKQLCRELRSK